jgi:hypothetical protein
MTWSGVSAFMNGYFYFVGIICSVHLLFRLSFDTPVSLGWGHLLLPLVLTLGYWIRGYRLGWSEHAAVEDDVQREGELK